MIFRGSLPLFANNLDINKIGKHDIVNSCIYIAFMYIHSLF